MTFLNLNYRPHVEIRKRIISTALQMNMLGINHGKAGNVSARVDEGFLITPTGIPYEETELEHIVLVRNDGSREGEVLPSSEWRFHHEIYAHRSDAKAVVHTHSSFATTLACMMRDIPAFHYMVAAAGGANIRCAPYATFGSQELSNFALKALQGRKACLLAHHGMIAVGESLSKSLALAVEVESLSRMFWQALQIGTPALLSDEEMVRVLEKFQTYGQQMPH